MRSTMQPKLLVANCAKWAVGGKYREGRRIAADRGKQGGLARSEQLRMQLGPELFAELDTNHDGIIQPEELESFLRRQKQKQARHQLELAHLEGESRIRDAEVQKRQAEVSGAKTAQPPDSVRLMTFDCPHCNRRVIASKEDAGKVAWCAGCAGKLQIPGGAGTQKTLTLVEATLAGVEPTHE